MLLPEPGHPGYVAGLGALDEIARHERQAVGVAAVEREPEYELVRSTGAEIRAGDPFHLMDALGDQTPALVVAALPYLPELDCQWPDLVSLFFSWRIALRLSGTLVVVCPAGENSHLAELLVPVARTARYRLVARHAAAHTRPHADELPTPRLTVYANVSVFTCGQEVNTRA